MEYGWDINCELSTLDLRIRKLLIPQSWIECPSERMFKSINWANRKVFIGITMVMEYSWNIHGIFMEYSWNIHGIFMGYSWDIMDIKGNNPLYNFGIYIC